MIRYFINMWKNEREYQQLITLKKQREKDDWKFYLFDEGWLEQVFLDLPDVNLHRSYDPWDKDEEEALLAALLQGDSFIDICANHYRSPGSIRTCLCRLGYLREFEDSGLFIVSRNRRFDK